MHRRATYVVIYVLPGGERSSAWLGFGVAAVAGALLTIPMRVADRRLPPRPGTGRSSRSRRCRRSSAVGGGGLGLAYWAGATLLVVALGAMFGLLLGAGAMYRASVGDG